MEKIQIDRIVDARLIDAVVLLNAKRFDGSV